MFNEIEKWLQENTEENVIKNNEDDSASDLRLKLRSCFTRHALKRAAMDDILALLRECGHTSLPKSSKSLMKTCRGVSKTFVEVRNGCMYYIGIAEGIERVVTESYLKDREVINLDIGWDGLTPFSSVKTNKVWPIIGRLSRTTDFLGSKPFTIAIYCGLRDPDPNEFFEDFVLEASDLMEDGLKLRGTTYKIQILKFIADQPARVLALCHNGHQSLICCARCTVKGKTRSNRTTITKKDCRGVEKRTDQSFREQWQKEFHTGESPLLPLKVDLINSVALDSMHLLYVGGVVKRWWDFITKSKYSVVWQLKEAGIKKASKFMFEHLRKNFPSEFSRRVRGIDEYKLWKATEWRRFALYDGILVVKQFIRPRAYRNFSLLFCALRILSSKDLVCDDALLDTAEQLLNIFLEDCEANFRPLFLTCKVHLLSHVTDDVRRYGVLDNFSAFAFENHLHHLNQMIHAPGRCLQQIMCRMAEAESLRLDLEGKDPNTTDCSVKKKPYGRMMHSSGPVTADLVGKCQEFYVAELEGFCVRLRQGDCAVKSFAGEIIIVMNIVKTAADKLYFVGKKFNRHSEFFHYPIKSSAVDVVVVSDLGDTLMKWHVSSIKCKIVLLPLDFGKKLCIPMLHEEEYDEEE